MDIVEVVDQTPPGILCPPTLDVDADPRSCSAGNVALTPPLTTDNCTTVSLVPVRSDNLPLYSPFDVGDTTVIWTVTDASGNATSCTQTVTVHDTTPPLIECPPTINIEAEAEGCFADDVEITTPTVVFDNCSSFTITGTRSDNLPLDAPYPVGDTVITWTIIDDAGNQASCTQKVTVQDMVPPEIVCAPPAVFNADPFDCSVGDVVLSQPLTMDNCSTVSLTAVRSDGKPLTDPFPVGNTSVVWTVTDMSNNATSCTQLVTVNDVTPPLVDCPDPVNVNADPQQCAAGQVAITPPVVVSENCTTTTLVGVRDDGKDITESYPVGVTTIVWTVTDTAGNETSCTQLVTVTDTTPPDITCPATITVNADSDSCSASDVNVTTPTLVSDNCSTVTVAGVRSDGMPLDADYPAGTTIIVWTATDAFGNTASCTQLVIVTDSVPPQITCPPSININADPQSCSAADVEVTTPTLVSDNCTSITISGTRSDGQPIDAPYPVGTTIIVWTVTDASGNTASCTQTVTVRDATPPILTCPPTLNIEADAQNCTAADVDITTPTADFENCTTVTITGMRDDLQPINAPYPLGVTTITWTATDTTGNSSYCDQLVIVTDTTGPNLTCPTNIIQGSDRGQCGAVVDFQLTASDSCGNTSVTVDSDPVSGSFFPSGTTTVTVTAMDGAENITTCSFTVTIVDNQDPQITCPADVMACMQTEIDLGTYIVTDNCDLQPTVTIVRSDNLPLDSPYPIGDTIITYTATDSSGNMDTCMQTVHISDNALPMIGCPDDITTIALAGLCVSDNINYPPVNVMDDCSTDTTNLTITYDPPSGTQFQIGDTTVTVTVVDADQNQAQCSFVVTVIDVTPPDIDCPGNMIVESDANQCGANNVTFNIDATDACSGPVIVTTDPPSGSNFPIGPTVVTVTATDQAGNVAHCMFTLTVVDNTPPTIQCPAPVDITADAEQCQAGEVQLGEPVIDDNCSIAGVMATRSDGLPLNAPYPVGVTIVTYKVTDGSDNMTTCAQTVTVNDSMAPEITCPTDIDIDAPSGQCQTGPVQYPAPVVSDNCTTDPGDLIVTYNPPQGSTFTVGETPVLVTVADLSGNETTCTFNITVHDVTPPTLNCPETMIVNSSPGQCGASNVTYQVGATDDCSGPAIVTTDPPSGSNFPIGNSIVDVTATDQAGNMSHCSFTVTVVDNQPPTIQCPPTVNVEASADTCQSAQVDIGIPLIGDNCSSPTVAGVRSDNCRSTHLIPSARPQ